MGTSALEMNPIEDGYERLRRNVSDNVYLLRYYKGMRRIELADEIGKDESHVWRIENGTHINLKNLASVANTLGTTPGKILDIDSRNYPEGRGFTLFIDRPKVLGDGVTEPLPDEVKTFVEKNFLA